MSNIDVFLQQYLETALWSSTNEDDEPLDKTHCVDDLADECWVKAREDCEKFIRMAGHLIERDFALAGHDFWLTRNGHGCGFWDEDWPEVDGKILSAIAESFGECYAFDNGDEWRLSE